MSRAEWIIGAGRLREYVEKRKPDEEVVNMLEDWWRENRPSTKVISLDEWRERRRQEW